MASRASLTQAQAAQQKRQRAGALIILLVIPAVLAIGVFWLASKWYLPLSLLILALTMAPFFMIFEKRKPKAREVVLIAMMSALTVVAHLFFHMVLPIQIGTALVIVSGISLGPEAGFLVGALSRFICNFAMGQGMWTPWQMVCWGILGFLAGFSFRTAGIAAADSPFARQKTEAQAERNFRVVLGPVLTVAFAELAAYASILLFPSNSGQDPAWRFYAFGAVGLLLGALLQKKRLPTDGLTLALFTFCTTFVVYGGIINIATMVTSLNVPGAQGYGLGVLRTLYLTGLPYDLLHAGTAAICVYLFGESIIRKLERVKIKYGIYS